MFEVFSKEIVREVEARMNREHTPPQLPALPATASLTHRHSRVSQVCPLPTVKEANRTGKGFICFAVEVPKFPCSERELMKFSVVDNVLHNLFLVSESWDSVLSFHRQIWGQKNLVKSVVHIRSFLEINLKIFLFFLLLIILNSTE